MNAGGLTKDNQTNVYYLYVFDGIAVVYIRKGKHFLLV